MVFVHRVPDQSIKGLHGLGTSCPQHLFRFRSIPGQHSWVVMNAIRELRHAGGILGLEASEPRSTSLRAMTWGASKIVFQIGPPFVVRQVADLRTHRAPDF